MRRDDVRFAAAARDDGIHKISKFTWRAGAAGVVCSALIAVAFGHHVATTPSSTDNNGTSQSHQPASGNNGSGTNQGSSNKGSNQGSSNKGSSNQGSSNQGSGGISVPAQPPAPAQGGGQVTSGAT
jgi:hypothetical protein